MNYFFFLKKMLDIGIYEYIENLIRIIESIVL